MDKVAALSARERRALFQEAASGRGMNPAVMEKDFWVSWVLGNLFRDVELKDHLIFKGGTTLSKIFGVIDRFSEDIDLILDWQLIGFGPDGRDPLEVFASATQQDRFNKEMNTLARNYIAGPLLKRLRVTLASMPGIEVALDHADGHTVNVGYPASFAVGYLRPEIRLEIGPLGSWLPSSEFTIQPYAAQALPEAFSTTVVRVKAIDAERTFWEKATILHQEAHRTSPVPTRYSRHYYDLFQLSESAVKAKALASPALLKDVVAFKRKFYPSTWARYDLAQPGSFRLLPGDAHAAVLAKDYQGMAQMIFGDAPAFDRILAGLRALQSEINAMPTG